MISSMTFQRTALVTAISAALVACGGGGGGSSTTTSASTAASIGGTAAKGILIGADVIVKNPVTLAELTSTTTDKNGKYSAELPAGYVGEVLVEVSANDDTLMVCDLTTCLLSGGTELDRDGEQVSGQDGIITFGEVYKPGADLSLKVLTTVTSGSTAVTANATPLTTMASNFAEVNGVSAAEANATIAAQAGLTTYALDALPVVDITDATAVSEASDDAINAAVTGAAIVEASGGIVKFEEATNYAAVYGETKLDLSTAATNINTAAGSTATVDNTVEEIIIPTDVDLDAVSKVQAFVAQVRVFEVHSNRVDRNVAAFGDAVSTIVANVDSEANSVAEEMTVAISAITSAIDYVLNSETDVVSFTEKDFQGFLVSYNAATGSYTVKATTQVADHDITATTSLTDAGTIDAQVTLSGSSASDTFSIELTDGSGLTLVGLDESIPDPSLSDSYRTKISSADVSLEIVMTDSSSNSGNNTFTGAFSVKLTGLDESGSWNETTQVDTETLKLNSGSFSLSGDFVAADYGSQYASVTLSTRNFFETWTDTDGNDWSYRNELSADELKAVLKFGADISGLTTIDNKVDVTATVTAMGSESESDDNTDGYTSAGEVTGDVVLTAEYDGSKLNFAYKVGSDSANGSLTNHNGVKLLLTEDLDTGVVTGSIYFGEESYADVSEDESGAIRVDYTYKGADGRFETL